jgi:hypothetical protein
MNLSLSCPSHMSRRTKFGSSAAHMANWQGRSLAVAGNQHAHPINQQNSKRVSRPAMHVALGHRDQRMELELMGLASELWLVRDPCFALHASRRDRCSHPSSCSTRPPPRGCRICCMLGTAVDVDAWEISEWVMSARWRRPIDPAMRHAWRCNATRHMHAMCRARRSARLLRAGERDLRTPPELALRSAYTNHLLIFGSKNDRFYICLKLKQL